jgi:hypothetical protein
MYYAIEGNTHNSYGKVQNYYRILAAATARFFVARVVM